VLDGLLYGVAAVDPLTFAGVAPILAAVATLAALVPAHRAASVNRIMALRH
jgi:putative ABC transport system permease protein